MQRLAECVKENSEIRKKFEELRKGCKHYEPKSRVAGSSGCNLLNDHCSIVHCPLKPRGPELLGIQIYCPVEDREMSIDIADMAFVKDTSLLVKCECNETHVIHVG